MVAYAIPIFCPVTFAVYTFKQETFHLGLFSELVGWIALFSYPIQLDTFNWAIVTVTGVFVLASVFWIRGARNTFTGPVLRVTEDETMILEQWWNVITAAVYRRKIVGSGCGKMWSAMDLSP
ncbi:hypothetical protein M427DRAFT_265490 [Gonapodya prolifera JEL478]|uniref:Uncharacterized protein n=1 Tax=Gonapodya prolifera (strain JEL478) TaxID=1344416 RepID=A0A139AKC4_GONPJ|nr:hypothetical protein M427DRAFT_265490 [Gonapodya prolifera JEL478]|eukprot:KXS17230.1 hypothetical protein M427DRAFT_265490 [Gonapodya prolifera JEL478]